MKFWVDNGTPQGFGHGLFADDLVAGPLCALKSGARTAQLFLLQRHHSGLLPIGGLGLLSAEWNVEGEPKLDMLKWDLARYGA